MNEAATEETIFSGLIEEVFGGKGLTRTEMTETGRLARGLCAKDSAAMSGVTPDAVRSRRKKVYEKLGYGRLSPGGAGRTQVQVDILAAALRRFSRPA